MSLSWRSREDQRTVPDWRRYPIWIFKCHSWLPHLRFQTLPCQYSLCPIPCILFLHNISQFLIYYMFFSLHYLFPWLEWKLSWGKGLWCVLFTTVPAMPWTGFSTYWTLEARINIHTTTFQITLILKTPFFKRLIYRESLKIHKKYNNPIENG